MNNLASLSDNFTQETQLFYADSGKRLEGEDFWEKLPEQWWVKIAEDPELQKEMAEILEIPFFSLFLDKNKKDEDSLKNLLLLRQQYQTLTKAKVKAIGVGIEDQVKKAKAAMDDLDEQNRVVYDAKANVGKDAIGYGSFHWGLTPERFQKMMGDDFPLTEKDILLGGCGTGDFLRFSVEKGKGKRIGIDISEGMVNVADKQVDWAEFEKGNLSEEVPEGYDLIILDYFLDVTGKPVDVLQNTFDALPEGGKCVITVLAPIMQIGADSFKEGTKCPQSIASQEQNIGNTNNPLGDAKKLLEKCKKIGFKPDNFSLTSYCQYDSGRSTAEIRPSFILTLTKLKNEK